MDRFNDCYFMHSPQFIFHLCMTSLFPRKILLYFPVLFVLDIVVVAVFIIFIIIIIIIISLLCCY